MYVHLREWNLQSKYIYNVYTYIMHVREFTTNESVQCVCLHMDVSLNTYDYAAVRTAYASTEVAENSCCGG